MSVYMYEYKRGRTRVWIDELPNIDMPPYEVLSADVRCDIDAGDATVSTITRRLAIEVQTYQHVSSYALLGAVFVPNPSMKSIHIEIRQMRSRGADIPWAFGYTPPGFISHQRVTGGFEAQYTAKTLAGVVNWFGNHPIPHPGTILFDVAACCEIRSSVFLFTMVAITLASILLDGVPAHDHLAEEATDRIVKAKDEYREKHGRSNNR